MLIVQGNQFNQNGPTVIIAALTSEIKKENLPCHVILGQRFGLQKPSMVLLEQMRTVNKSELGACLGIIDERETMKKIENALKKTLGIQNLAPGKSPEIRCLCPRCAEQL